MLCCLFLWTVFFKTSISRRRLELVNKMKICTIWSMVFNGLINEEVLVHDMKSNRLKTRKKKIWLWHRGLGHTSFGYLRRLFSSLFHDCNLLDFVCENYVMMKSRCIIFSLNNNKVDAYFSLVHLDVWDLTLFSTHNGIKWFITFVNDCTRMTWVYLLTHKSDVCEVFRLFY